jgi:hypothetical protein
LLANQSPMSAPDPALHDGEQDGCEDREGVADQGGLERALGLLHLRRVTAGGEVTDTADGQEEGGDTDQQANDPRGDVCR